MDRYLQIPIKQRGLEKLINPFEAKWQKRYYKYLFHQEHLSALYRGVFWNFMHLNIHQNHKV